MTGVVAQVGAKRQMTATRGKLAYVDQIYQHFQESLPEQGIAIVRAVQTERDGQFGPL
jgi:hypothetical protein